MAYAVQKLVYLSLRELLVGEHAQLRKKKAIRKTILEHQNTPKIKDLMQRGYDVDVITRLVQPLLEEQIFESSAKARARFPDAFEPVGQKSTGVGVAIGDRVMAAASTEFIIPVQGVVAGDEMVAESCSGPAASGTEVAIGNATAIQFSTDQAASEVMAVTVNTTTKEHQEIDPIKVDANLAAGTLQGTTLPGTLQPDPQPQLCTIPLDYVSLPFWYQHRIMVRIQGTLERACFTFAQKMLGGVLQREGWDCAEAVELSRWENVLLQNEAAFARSDLDHARRPLSSLLTSISQLRHATVHRLRLPARSALDLIMDAESLAKLLQNEDCLERVSATRQQLGDSIEGLERNKRSLEARLADIRQRFVVKRIKLERKEAALLEAAEEESRERDFFGQVCSDHTLDALSEAQARWKGTGSVSLPVECLNNTRGIASPSSDPERTSKDEATATEKEGSEADVPLFPHSRSESKFSDESNSLRGPQNDSSYDDWSMTTDMEKTDHDSPEEHKTTPALNTLSLDIGAFPLGTLPKLKTSLTPSPCSSYCEDYATPWHSRSPVEETSSVTSDGAYFETESGEASISTSTFCPFRTSHLLEEKMWQHCDRCRAFLFRAAGQLDGAVYTDADGTKFEGRARVPGNSPAQRTSMPMKIGV